MLLSERPDLPAAKHHCEQALEHKPDHAKAHHLMGNILASQRDASAAPDAYKRAEALSSDAASSCVNSASTASWITPGASLDPIIVYVFPEPVAPYAKQHAL